MAEIELFEKCAQCNGTGMHRSAHGEGTSSAIPCNWPGCNGTGFISHGKFQLDPSTGDIVDKVNDVLEKCNDILDKLNE